MGAVQLVFVREVMLHFPTHIADDDGLAIAKDYTVDH
jgi:hypothetical protein